MATAWIELPDVKYFPTEEYGTYDWLYPDGTYSSSIWSDDRGRWV